MTNLELKELAERAFGYVAERRDGMKFEEPGMPPKLALDMIMDAGIERHEALRALHGAAHSYLLQDARVNVSVQTLNGWHWCREVLWLLSAPRRIVYAAEELARASRNLSSLAVYSSSEIASRTKWFEWAAVARVVIEWLADAQGVDLGVPA